LQIFLNGGLVKSLVYKILIVIFCLSVIDSYSQVNNDYYKKIVNKVKTEGLYAEYLAKNGKTYSGYVLYLKNSGLWIHINFPGKRILDSFIFLDDTDYYDIDFYTFRGVLEMGTKNIYLEQIGKDKSGNYRKVQPKIENINDIIVIFLNSKSEKRTYSQAVEAIKRSIEGGILSNY